MKTQIRFPKNQLPLTITGGFNMNRFTHPLTRAFKILSVFILLTISFVHAQFVNMSGHIIAGEMNGIVAPLPGAHVNIQGTDAQAVSDSTGFYELSFLWNWNGPVTAECHAEGFGSQSETFFPNSDTVELDFLLNPLPDEDITHLQGHILQIECGDCPIPGAQITAFNINSPSDETYTTHSAENGHYLLPLPLVPEYGFTWNITVQHPGFQAQSLQLEIGPAGMIHDFRLKEGAFLPGFLNPRRTVLEDTLDDFFFTPDYSSLIGASRTAGRGQVVNLDVRRRIAELALPGMPHLGSGITWKIGDRTVLATPNLREGVVSVIDVRDWKILRNIPTPGPGFFIRSHEASRYAWVDSMMSPKNRDTLTVIDKQTLEVVAQLRPEPGKTVAHIEFTADGTHALASLWEDEGALIVFDARTLRELKRIPARKPVGKYNLHNKITRSEGTSH